MMYAEAPISQRRARVGARHMLEVVASLTVLVVGALFLGVPSASASQPCTTNESNGHCYSTAFYSVSSPMWGGSATVESDALTAAHPSSGFVTNELWVGTDGTDFNEGDVSQEYWVEVGMISGVAAYGCTATSDRFFWFDHRPDGSYHCHDGANISLGGNYNVSVKWAGSDTWHVWEGSTEFSSTPNACCSYGLIAGVESMDNTDVEDGYDSVLKKEDTSGNWTNNWPGSVGGADAPATFTWAVTNQSFVPWENFHGGCCARRR